MQDFSVHRTASDMRFLFYLNVKGQRNENTKKRQKQVLYLKCT